MYYSQKRVVTNRSEDITKLPQSISHVFLIQSIQIHIKEDFLTLCLIYFISKLEIK